MDEGPDDKDTIEEGNMLQDSPLSSTPWSKVEPLSTLKYELLLPSLQHPPELELKSLLDSLKYAFLGLDHTLPIIITSNLTSAQESKLLDALKKHR